MTTIILTIIGILLAAAAALMVIFYGGDAFNSGSTGASANTYQNAGTNVVSAVQLFRTERSASTMPNFETNTAQPAWATSLFHPNCTTGGSCLKELPSLPAGASYFSGNFYMAHSVPIDVCSRINKNLKIADHMAPSAANKMGCYVPAQTATGAFYATL